LSFNFSLSASGNAWNRRDAAKARSTTGLGTSWMEQAMHLFKEHGVKDYARAAAAIPVIDYGPYFAGEKDALERVAAEVRRACAEIGFFYALNLSGRPL
jgi:hypothetical protein